MFEFMQKRKSSGLDRRTSLMAIPVVNASVVSVPKKQGLEITLDVRRGDGFLARFQPPVMQRRVELDEIGAAVYGMIDGERSALDIVNWFVGQYKVNRREAELSCVEFLKSLAQRGVISIAVR
ncbi:MAG: hypothetical protein A2498_15375 [Lentisphaerae bacterium RIFOXYC12_FULL_60_16]|nr:MAG: hypothetical protein A2498_15375 [Lentisphaerae bacterium RIFOXYC12_FULL_60_16]OGV72393.1 MAG: hypothetical protein A2269_03740 [Lentisphaerae bacterium RIFOXYA12_FULL_60_10]OGV78556.1 MAG: hypothetical protein A2340_12140 [Lentisphaerae bacterium RIFOXYB12_FULL_60_10]